MGGTSACTSCSFRYRTFWPDKQITRAEMAVILARALDLDLDMLRTTNFNDDAAILQWAKGAVEALREKGILSGKSGNNYAPDQVATRAEVVAVLLRILIQQKS
ncbi:S-layer homology domain-containing protein [Paenibacillus sp. IITD108]